MSAAKGSVPWNAGAGKGWTDKRGYRWIYVSENGRRRARREHRVIAEGEIGRRLEPWESVHHRDGNTSNNDPANLEVVAHDQHTISHHVGTKRPEGAKRAIAVFSQMREEIFHLRAVNADLLAALNLLLADVADYPAWQRPCHAVDVARAAIAKATGGPGSCAGASSPSVSPLRAAIPIADERVRWLENIASAAANLCRYYEKSVNVGPFSNNPRREILFWNALRSAIAQGIEAQRAETQRGAVEDESPVPEGDAP